MFCKIARPWKLLGGNQQIPTPTQNPAAALLSLLYTGNCKRDFIWKIGSLSKRSLETTYLVQSEALWLEGRLKPIVPFPLGICRLFLRWVFTSAETFLPSGKADKATGLEESEQHYWPWKFWQHNTLIFCFIISNLRLCHWCSHSLCLTPMPLGATWQLWLPWQTYAIPHIPEGEREVQVVTANGSPRLPPARFLEGGDWAPSRWHMPWVWDWLKACLEVCCLRKRKRIWEKSSK